MSTPVIPSVIAGLTEDQIHAYFAEVKKITGITIGYSGISPTFNTWESLMGGSSKKGDGYICEHGLSIAETVSAHNAQRPATGAELAAEKRKQAEKLLAEADAIAPSGK